MVCMQLTLSYIVHSIYLINTYIQVYVILGYSSFFGIHLNDITYIILYKIMIFRIFHLPLNTIYMYHLTKLNNI